MNREHGQPVVEVFPEPARGGCLLQVAIGRGDDAGVNRNRLRPAQPEEGLLLQEAEQFDLEN